MAARRILVLLAHPVLERSRINRALADTAARVDGVTVHDLYEEYPSSAIEVKREQALLVAHDVVIFQHPFYWYSTPSILKEWQDLVLEHNWAYGEHGHHLEGKLTFNALTTGGPEQAYREGGSNRFTIRQFLAAYDQTAYLCHMRYLAPFVVHGAFRIDGPDALVPHLDDYRRLLEALRDFRLDVEQAEKAPRMNDPLSALILSHGAQR